MLVMVAVVAVGLGGRCLDPGCSSQGSFERFRGLGKALVARISDILKSMIPQEVLWP